MREGTRLYLLFILLLGWAACTRAPATPTASARAGPTRARPTAVRPTPRTKPLTPQARPPQTRAAPSALVLHVQGPEHLPQTLWQAVLTHSLAAREFWLGHLPSTWAGPSLPNEARVLITARGDGPAGPWMSVDFTLDEADLPKLQAALADSGWEDVPHPESAFAPGLTLTELRPNAGDPTRTGNLYLLRVDGAPRLWARIWVIEPATEAVADTTNTPWGLPPPEGWQAGAVRYTGYALDGRLRGQIFLVELREPIPLAALGSAWEPMLQTQGWERATRGASAHLRWIAWRQGDRRRALLAAQLPWSPRTVLAFAYEWEEGPPPAPRWHGRLSDIDARQAALQALVLRDPNLPPELTVILGALPEGATWPRAEPATAAYARVAGHEIQAGLRLAGSASEALGHLTRTGWAWRAIDQHAAAPALLAGPWPELASPGETPILAGALCREEQAALARLWPFGWLTLRTSPGLCQAAGEGPALGILPAPVGYPQKAFGALRLAYASYGDAQRWSAYAFGLPLAAGPAQAWLGQSVAALQARGWAVTRDASQGFYALRPTGQPAANILGFAVPVFENRTLFGLIADR